MITDLKVSIFLLNGDREQKQLLHPTLLTTVNWKERPFASAPQHMTHLKSRLGQLQPNFRTLPLQLHSPAHAALSSLSTWWCGCLVVKESKDNMFASANFFFKKKLPTLFDTVTANSYEHWPLLTSNCDMPVDSVTGSIRQQLKPVLDSPFTLRLGLGTLKPGTDHRAEPNRNIGFFGCSVRCRLLDLTNRRVRLGFGCYVMQTDIPSKPNRAETFTISTPPEPT